MGAIQPGVNRCKLISRHDFETLYTDCTNTRPGRPPKRAHGLLSPDSMLPHHGLLSPGVLSPPGLGPTGGVSSGAAFPESLKMKKLKLEAVNGVHGNGNPGNKEGDATEMCSASAGGGEGLWDRGKHHSPKTPLTPPGMSAQPLSATHGPPTSHPLTQLQQSSLFSNGAQLPLWVSWLSGHSQNVLGLEHMGSALPFMMMSHPLLPVSLPHAASVTMAMGHMTHLGGGGNASNMAAGAGEAQPGHPLRLDAGLKERSEERDSSPEPSPMRRQRSEEPPSPRHCSPPALAHGSIERLGVPLHGCALVRACVAGGVHQNGLCVGPVPLPAMAPRPGSHARDDAKHDGNDRGLAEQKDGMAVGMLAGTAGDKQHSLASLAQLHADFPAAAFLFPDGLSSTETLLTNIQGLLKVAADSARAQDKQAQLEKSELRLEILREREVREALERELATEQRNRELVQKRLKKEKKAKRKLQEALEFEGKRREQAEHALTQATNPDGLRGLGEPLSPMMEGERSGQGENERVAQQAEGYTQGRDEDSTSAR
ncbi:dachshund homolog 1-like isoform X2 [Lampetra fluviatilis]